MEKLVVCAGDVHGCLEEFQELLNTLQYDKEQMRLVLLGDLVDRGPDSAGCVRLAREMDLECIMGNHEDKHIRWRRHEKKKEASGKPNPMRNLSRDKRKVFDSLSEEDFVWLEKRPLKTHLFGNTWAVHGGCDPRFTLEKQPPNQIIRIRYVNDEGIPQSLGPNYSQPKDTVYWSEVWQGPESIVYGHCVHDYVKPRMDNHNGYMCLGIDTGCCFGGMLTAAVFREHGVEFVQVKAKQEYYARLDED